MPDRFEVWDSGELKASFECASAVDINNARNAAMLSFACRVGWNAPCTTMEVRAIKGAFYDRIALYNGDRHIQLESEIRYAYAR